MYALIKKILFCFDTERAHAVALNGLQIAHRLRCLNRLYQPIQRPVTVAGIHFPNPMGLAAGLDKNARYVDALHELGFGFIEVGTVTPKPQMGHPRPRLFRLTEHDALINRMGFNNCGLDQFINNLQTIRTKPVLGINIGKNATTPPEHAIDDYLECLERVYRYATYITINISSPNTQGLRDLQQGQKLDDLLNKLKKHQAKLAQHHQRYVPLAIKVAPDLSIEDIQTMGTLFLHHKIDIVIATNTTLSRPIASPLCAQAGGLSGSPLRTLANSVLQQFHDILKNQVALIGVGGITDTPSAQEKFDHGASLIQLYTGFIYQGPRLIRDIMQTIS